MWILEGFDCQYWCLGPFRPNYDTKSLPESSIFKVGPSNLNMFILVVFLKSYIFDKFNFGDFHFLPYVADRPNFDRLGGSEFLRFLKSESFQSLRVLKSLPEQQGSCI